MLAAVLVVSLGCGTGGTGGTGGSEGECTPSTPCEAEQWCDYPDDLCGAGLAGRCRASYSGDCNIYMTSQQCYCGGVVELSACSGIDFVPDVSKDPGLCGKKLFPCGTTECHSNVEYCLVTDATTNPTYECRSAPPACPYGIVDCKCVTGSAADPTCSHFFDKLQVNRP